MADHSIAGASTLATTSEGDRSGRARIVIVLLCLGLALAALLSLTSGASDASAVSVVRDRLADPLGPGRQWGDRYVRPRGTQTPEGMLPRSPELRK